MITIRVYIYQRGQSWILSARSSVRYFQHLQWIWPGFSSPDLLTFGALTCVLFYAILHKISWSAVPLKALDPSYRKWKARNSFRWRFSFWSSGFYGLLRVLAWESKQIKNLGVFKLPNWARHVARPSKYFRFIFLHWNVRTRSVHQPVDPRHFLQLIVQTLRVSPPREIINVQWKQNVRLLGSHSKNLNSKSFVLT